MDVLGAIYEARGKRKPPRASADRSIRTTGHLLDYDAGTWLATVSVHNSAPIPGVPATPADYVGLGITTVSVLLDPETGRPVQVLGPASDVAVGGAGGIAPPPGAGGTRIVRGRVFLPVDTGTWDTDAESWDTISTYGGVTDARQETSAGPNLIPNPEPLPAGEWISFPNPTYSYASIDGSGWSATVDTAASLLNRIYDGEVPIGQASTFWADLTNTSKANFTIYPVPAGMDAAPVAPDVTYTIACRSAVGWWSTEPDATLGVTWYDDAGDVISSADASPVAFVEFGTGEGTWWDQYDETPLANYGFCEASPSAEFTAPAGAAYARPRVLVSSSGSALDQVYVALFSMVAA